MNGLCERCVQGGILEGECTGRMEEGAYFAPAPGSGPLSGGPKTCLVLLTDIFGLPLNNSKLIADEMAKKTGADVWIPDLFAGKPPVGVNELNSVITVKPGDKRSTWGILGLIWLLIRRLPLFIRSRPSVSDARARKFAESLRKDKGYVKIGSFGYCWGGGVSGRLTAQKVFDSSVIFHPSKLSKDLMRSIDVPVAFGCAESDDTFPPEYAHECEAIFAERKKSGGPEYEFKHYEGVCHGFAARPYKENPVGMQRFQEAFTQTAEWFEKTLKSPQQDGAN